MLPSQADVSLLLHYDPQSGIFVWKSRDNPKSWNSLHAGKLAGGRMLNGYVKISINGYCYYAHRLAWLLAKGQWPKGQLDHIDGNRSNNAINNLREATPSQNAQNKRVMRGGAKGVYLHKASGLWHAAIMTNGVKRSLGYFRTEEEAGAARAAAALADHGEFARVA